MQAIELTQRFLQHVFQGEMAQALALVAPEARFISTRPTPNPTTPCTALLSAPKARSAFSKALPRCWSLAISRSRRRLAMPVTRPCTGGCAHRHRGTGRDFASDWALISRVEGGRLVLYHFFEDTEALREAMTPA
jgi:ketosteroid isomerase-like protein